MAPHALAFAFNRQNRHSIAVLIGAVETDGRFGDLDIHLLDPRSDLGEQIEALAAQHQRLVVGFSFTTFNVLEVFEAVQAIRERLASQPIEHVTLVAGGPHASGDWRRTLEMGFDIVVVGEGERSFPELLGALCEGRDVGHIPGVAACGSSGPTFSGRSPRVENLDDVPPFAERFGLFSMIEITRGCPWACRFCQATSLFGARMRHRSVSNIVEWAKKSKQFDEEWDVFLLGGRVKRYQITKWPLLIRVLLSRRAHAYCVHCSYLPTLKKCYEEAYASMKEDLFVAHSLEKALDFACPRDGQLVVF